MKSRIAGLAAILTCLSLQAAEEKPGPPLDVAPFGLQLPEGVGLQWEDPREIHKVVAQFQGTPPDDLALEYWGSRWPEQRLPKDTEPGGGDVGWMELGNWYRYDWRRADAEVHRDGASATFTFRPVNATEFPGEKGYAATFRYTLKIRLVSAKPLPALGQLNVYTDSRIQPRTFRLAWAKDPGREVRAEAFNGTVDAVDRRSARETLVHVRAAFNPDPNTLDLTLVTVRRGTRAFTFRVRDLESGPLFAPSHGVAVFAEGDGRTFAQLEAATRQAGARTLYDRVSAHPEQSWESAWKGMPAKKSFIYFPLGLDGGRQRFRLNADGSVWFRSNDHYLRSRPGADTPRLELEPAEGSLAFELPDRPVFRTLAEEALPICTTVWEVQGLRLTQTALVVPLDGTPAPGRVPNGDTTTVFLAEFAVTNTTAEPRTFRLPLQFKQGPPRLEASTADAQSWLWSGSYVRGMLHQSGSVRIEEGAKPALNWELAPGTAARAVLKLPYVLLTNKAEKAALQVLDFGRERDLATRWWRERLAPGARLITPEPMLNEFYRSHAMHLLVNCEHEPDSTRRFARVGSFSYGAYGNESCMMVEDLERRGFHREAEECLDAWLHYQGTVALPGDFASKDGVLYGAGGYEAGGYNQHHGWILWSLAEHYRFTRDDAWLRRVAGGMVAGADWIIRETARTADRHPLERGLLPAGSLEDIGDWWTWLSTSCYMWRGLDAVADVLGQLEHPQAPRLRRAADAYRAALLANFREASVRSPLVRLRDGTAVSHIPSQVHRRGRSFGWICETLEGSLHLLITRALDPRSPEALAILQDYEDNRFLSNQYGYMLPDFERDWFGRGGMSMQACLLLNVEPYLYRDDVKHALRGLFNGLAVSYFPDVRMNTEHALPEMGDWRGDQFKSSDEANAAGWLRYLFVREEGNELLVGQGVPRDWLRPGKHCGIERTATWFGPTSVLFLGADNQITAQLDGPTRNPPKKILLRFRTPNEHPVTSVTVNGKRWNKRRGDWVELPGNLGKATIRASYE